MAEFEKIYVPVQPRHKVRAQAVSLSSSLIKERKRATITPCTPASVKISGAASSSAGQFAVGGGNVNDSEACKDLTLVSTSPFVILRRCCRTHWTIRNIRIRIDYGNPL